MKAFRCDICGNYYEGIAGKNLPKDALTLGNQHEDFDICPYCRSELAIWVAKRRLNKESKDGDTKK